jgi:hypothetical protein
MTGLHDLIGRAKTTFQDDLPKAVYTKEEKIRPSLLGRGVILSSADCFLSVIPHKTRKHTDLNAGKARGRDVQDVQDMQVNAVRATRPSRPCI